jgi:hypothetical protein
MSANDRRRGGGVHPAHVDLAVVRFDQRRHDSDECRLAGTIGSEPSDHLAGTQLQIHVAQCRDIPVGVRHASHLEDRPGAGGCTCLHDVVGHQ